MSKIAVIDIGTNSIHMVLAEVEPDGSYKILDWFKDMTRLGDGTFRQRRLSAESRARGVEVLKNLTTLARNKGFDRILMAATSAVREARNSGQFVEEVSKSTGVRVKVVTGQEEARLIYLGVRQSMDLTHRPTLLVDVGGGSVELIVGNRDRLLHAVSLKLGAIRLKDLFLTKAPPTRAKLRAMHEVIDKELHAAFERFRQTEYDRVVISSGMAANLAEIIYLERIGSPIPQINLSTITLKEMRAVEQRLATSDVETRLGIPGLDPRRVDTLLAATSVIRQCLEAIGHKEATISDRAMREGLVYDFIQKNRERLRIEKAIPNIRLRNVVTLARRCHYPETHSRHVATLAKSLFDQTKPLHGMDEQEREWLDYAALLHDVGYAINPRQHHKHSYYLITNSDLAGFTAEEIEMIANVARFHRRALPGTRHLSYNVLSPARRKVMEKLSAILRIADGLDRSHFSVIHDVRVTLGKTVNIELKALADSELEIWTAQSRADLFQKIFGREVTFTVQVEPGLSTNGRAVHDHTDNAAVRVSPAS